MRLKRFLFLPLLCILLFQISSCKTSRSIVATPNQEIQPLKLSGGLSGMEQIDDQSYLVVYDIKKHKEGTRLAMVQITDETIQVSPIRISGWNEGGRSNDLESICKIPGTTNEYLMAESGNWEGKLGRIFHIRVNTTTLSAQVLGTTQLPYKDINTLELVGDQYESMMCLLYSESERILMLAERGGSEINPRGNIKWGIYNLSTHKLTFSDAGIKGITVNAPGNWTDEKNKRDITDLHMDAEGGIWAAASEDTTDVGPFYSVIYKLGQLTTSNKKQPLTVYPDFTHWTPVAGFKIEALSGPPKNINATLSFGTEDEIFGGVWRPISVD
ncbi:hypothetical protein ACFO3O_10010 [Dokdonia ponticola]|uniref:SdiA-regulated family protein n=1 Tax=Dokdonia ponticola TaxID=2041041 RepID=A0ABV9HWP8_9FLAO